MYILMFFTWFKELRTWAFYFINLCGIRTVVSSSAWFTTSNFPKTLSLLVSSGRPFPGIYLLILSFNHLYGRVYIFQNTVGTMMRQKSWYSIILWLFWLDFLVILKLWNCSQICYENMTETWIREMFENAQPCMFLKMVRHLQLFLEKKKKKLLFVDLVMLKRNVRNILLYL